VTPDTATPYTWSDLTRMVFAHRRELVIANLVAILGATAAVPVPLLIPLLVDEVLLHQPGAAIASMNGIFPESWHGPALYILAILALTLLLRLVNLAFSVWQTREFTQIAKDVVFVNEPGEITAYSLADGRPVWSKPNSRAMACAVTG
jgi:ATP-binding cassette subfamily C protein